MTSLIITIVVAYFIIQQCTLTVVMMCRPMRDIGDCFVGVMCSIFWPPFWLLVLLELGQVRKNSLPRL